MERRPVVHRCQACGAPLPADTPLVRCRYCDAENALVANMRPLIQAADEAREMAERNRVLVEAIDAELSELLSQMAAGYWELEDRYLARMEASVRLTFAPTMHFLRAQNPSDPGVMRQWREIDAVVEDVVTKSREALQKVREEQSSS